MVFCFLVFSSLFCDLQRAWPSYRMRFSKQNWLSGCPVGAGGEISFPITQTTSHVSAVACHYGNVLWKEGVMESRGKLDYSLTFGQRAQVYGPALRNDLLLVT